MENFLDYLPHDPTFWVAVSFTIFVLLAVVKGRGALVGIIDKNIADIKKQLHDAEKIKKEAEDIYKLAHQQLQDTEKLAKEIIDTSREYGDLLMTAAAEKLQKQLAQKEKQLTERLAQEESRLKNQFIKDIAEEAIAMAEASLAESLKKGQGHADATIKDAIKKITKLQ